MGVVLDSSGLNKLFLNKGAGIDLNFGTLFNDFEILGISFNFADPQFHQVVQFKTINKHLLRVSANSPNTH